MSAFVGEPPENQGELLARAYATIARQAGEIEQLRREAEAATFARELARLLSLTMTVGTIAAPVEYPRLLEMILETAAHVIGAPFGAVFLVDPARDGLELAVSLGQIDSQLSIAGSVGDSGQPILAGNQLCVPLLVDDRVVGAVELVDKGERAHAFTSNDLDTLELFGRQASAVIDQSRAYADAASLVDEVIGLHTDGPEDVKSKLREQARAISHALTRDSQNNQALDLAKLVQQLVRIGAQEARTCEATLRAFAELEEQQRSSDEPLDAFWPVTLTDAQAFIARQLSLIESLRGGRAAKAERDVALREALCSVQVLNAAASASPHARLLETIVATAARAVRTRYGSLFLVDEDTQELVFEVSLRERIEDLRTFRLPLGRGIAGMVAITGQAIAVSDVASDPRHAAEIAQQTGYTPRNMLCVPLQSGDRVLGVLQLLDKVGNDAFTIADMEAVGLFANQAAVTIEQSSMHRSVLGLLARGLRRLAELAAGPTQAMPSAEPDFASGGPQDPAYQRALELARLVNEIAEHGEDVGKACSAVLHSLTAYVGAQPLGTAEPAQ